MALYKLQSLVQQPLPDQCMAQNGIHSIYTEIAHFQVPRFLGEALLTGQGEMNLFDDSFLIGGGHVPHQRLFQCGGDGHFNTPVPCLWVRLLHTYCPRRFRGGTLP